MGNRFNLADGTPAHIAAGPYPWQGPGIEHVMTRLEAFELVARAKGKTPADWLSWMHLGTALHIAGESERGLECARKALSMERNASTLLNVAVTLEYFGRFSEALKLAYEAVLNDPTNQFSGLLWAQALLRQGRWEDGWPPFEYYSWGNLWQGELAELGVPPWEGEPLEGKRILVIQGGGFGDNLMFFRWFANLRTADRVTYACPEVMAPLLHGHPWVDEIIPVHEGPDTGDLPEFDLDLVRDGKPLFDYAVPIMGLARRCGATVESLQQSWAGPYIRCETNIEKLLYVKPLIGICWSGAEKLDPRRHRSLTIKQRDRLLEFDGCTWVNLQYGLEAPPHVLQPNIQNWKDTARIIHDLDLVVTVDTGVMHLAGAMGKKCWVMIPGLSDWKFLLGRETSPFYPSLRLFRNEGEGIDNALDKVTAELNG